MNSKKYKFSIEIDDEEHPLSDKDGISFDRFSELLKDLFQAINPGHNTKCTLGKIRKGSYAADFYSTDREYAENFEVVHKNISAHPVDDLPIHCQPYARTLKKILGGKLFLRAVNSEGKIIARVDKEVIDTATINHYYSISTVYGVLSLIGSASVDSATKVIMLDGVSYRIAISKEQDLRLKNYYGTHKLMVKVRQKRSSLDGHIMNAEMISFLEVGQSDLVDSLKEEGYIDFALISGTNTLDEVVQRIYGNK